MVKQLLIATLFATLGCRAQNNTLPSYSDFIAGMIQSNPLSKRAANEAKYGEYLLKASRGNYDPVFNGSYDQKQFSGTNYFSTLSSEIKQPVFTNQYLKLGYDYGTGLNINPELKTPGTGLPYLGFEVGVLQGLVIDKRRADVLKSKAYLNYYTAEQKIQLNDLLFEGSLQYFEWLYSAKQIALNTYFLNAAKQRLEGIQALAEIGERASVDTVEAAILYQTRLLDLQNALMDGQKNTNGLSVFIWQNDLPLGVGITYQSTDSLDVYYNKATSALLEHLAQNEIQNPIISKYNAYQKVLDTELRLKKEMIKPILNVKYNFLAKNSSAINSMFSDNNYKWGVNMSFPLLLRNPTNEYKMAKINSENNTLELSNKTNELNFKVNALKQNISILAQQLLNAEQSVKYSKLLLEAERLKFQNGESSVFMINNRENKVLDTELKLAEYKLKFIKTVLQVIYLNGNLSYRL